MLLKLDENLGRSHIELVRNSAPDRVYDEGVSGWKDSAVWKRVCDEGRFFITLDLDFADVRRFEPGSHPGIHPPASRAKSKSNCGAPGFTARSE